ncbi:unnamed protein product [Closterium sp. Naga37s-1]|nr:unnamed protein product [Closterium sp. Naga37s-1]
MTDLLGSVPSSTFSSPSTSSLPQTASSSIHRDISNNEFAGPLPSGFSSPSLASLPLATFNVEKNFFTGSARAEISAGKLSFCPEDQQGGFAAANLLLYSPSQYGSVRGNCLNPRGGGGCEGEGRQRKQGECLAFCGVGSAQGVCGGHGRCFLKGPSRVPVCECEEGYYEDTVEMKGGGYPTCSATKPENPPPPFPPDIPLDGDDPQKQRHRPGLRDRDFKAVPATTPSRFNRFFRHVSLGFNGSAAQPSWAYRVAVDWRGLVLVRGRNVTVVPPVKDQGLCGECSPPSPSTSPLPPLPPRSAACWDLVLVAAIEAAYAIAYGANHPNLVCLLGSGAGGSNRGSLRNSMWRQPCNHSPISFSLRIVSSLSPPVSPFPQSAACWALVPVAAIEAAYAIAYGANHPNLSSQQVLSCQGTWQCTGGIPADAFQFVAAVGGVSPEKAVPYTGVVNASDCKVGSSMSECVQVNVGPPGHTLKPMITDICFLLREEMNSHLPEPPAFGLSLPSSPARPSPSASPNKFEACSCCQTQLARPIQTPKLPPTTPVPPSSSPPPPAFPPQVPGIHPLSGRFAISMFEQVSVPGWLGMVLALQAQPIIANVEADQLSFINYQGGFIYADPDCFANGVVNHIVLLVGYSMVGVTPYFILQNTWGSTWGEGGFMQMAIEAGNGICGISTTPALYPVVAGSHPCQPINPCGSGKCSNRAGKSKCACAPGFTAAKNIDGSETCIPVHVCAMSAANPCQVGTCLDDGVGGYNCLCPPGFVADERPDETPVCVPGVTPSEVHVVPGLTCDSVRSTFGMSEANFTQLNPKLNCSSLATGDDIYVSDGTLCATPYTVTAVSP